MNEPGSWSSQVDIIKLRHPLPITIHKSAVGVDIFCKSFGLVGSGDSPERALQMLFDHLMIDYYEYSLNPGAQSIGDSLYGRRVKLLFNSEQKDRLVPEASPLATQEKEKSC